MLFRLKSGVDPFELNPGARAIKEFDELTSMQFFFVCLVADVDQDNPLHTLPDNQKRAKAAQIAGYGMEGTRPDKNARNMIGMKVPSVEQAILRYRDTQFDEDKANLAAIERQILEIRDYLERDKEKASAGDAKLHAHLLLMATKISQDLPKLVEQKKELIKVIKSKETIQLGITTHTHADITEQESELMEDEDEPMSTIDIVMGKKDATN